MVLISDDKDGKFYQLPPEKENTDGWPVLTNGKVSNPRHSFVPSLIPSSLLSILVFLVSLYIILYYQEEQRRS